MSVLGTAVSGLLAYQRALATTGHNISNATTDGYSRQRVNMEAQTPQRLGSAYLGQGVRISSVERIQSDLVDAQLRTAKSNNANADLRTNYAESIDLFLSDETTGLEPVLETFFNSVQDVANDPTSISARTVMVNESDTLVDRLGQLDHLLDSQRELINGNIESTVDEINQYSESLADLNTRIVSGYGGGAAPNDLLDQRGEILNELSEKIDVSVITQDDGSISLFIGNGQSLVSGGVANQLVADHLSGDPENLEIGLKTRSGNTPIDVTRFMSGGEIGGLIETRTDMIDAAQNQIGLIGLTVASQFNAQNRLGLDLNGDQGSDLFNVPDVAVNAKKTNTASSNPAVEISDVASLTTDDYRLSFDGAGYRMLRLPDNASATLTENPSGSGIYEIDGLSIDTTTITGAQAGDSWLIQPTRFAAGGLGVAISDPEKVAAAGAMRAEASEGNTGTASIESVAAVDADTLDQARAVLAYDGANYTLTLPSSSSVTPSISLDSTTGITTITANGWELKLSGTPAAGDEFVIESNAGYPGDNRNILAMGDIQSEYEMQGGTTIQESYNGLLSDVGAQTRQIQIARDSSATVLEDAQSQRDAMSGVNLDEEAANLVRLQQAYSASAKVIAAASEMFDALISAVR